MLEPMMRVSFRFLVCCLRVCRTVDPAGITLSLVCWAPIVYCPPYIIVPCPSPVLLADPGYVRGDQIRCSPARRHPRAHFTSGTRKAPPASSLTSRSSSAYLVVRARHRERVGPPTLSKRRSRCGKAYSHFYMSIISSLFLSLAASRHI